MDGAAGCTAVAIDNTIGSRAYAPRLHSGRGPRGIRAAAELNARGNARFDSHYQHGRRISKGEVGMIVHLLDTLGAALSGAHQ
jgi:hypothetical protein